MRRKQIGWGLFALIVLAQLIPKGQTNPEADPQESLLAIAELTPELQGVLQRSCFDCHSNETTWPWYANITPVGQWLAHHVDEGRQHLNFSRWGVLSDARHAKLLEEMEEEVGEGHMPLPNYLWIHREAALSEAQKGQLLEWCRSERAKVQGRLDSTE